MRNHCLIILLFFIPLIGQAFTGNTLLDACQVVLDKEKTTSSLTHTEAMEEGVCLGYITGFYDQQRLLAKVAEVQALYCKPDNSDVKQFIRVVVKHLKDNPEKLHFHSSTQVHSALSEAFPCDGEKE